MKGSLELSFLCLLSGHLEQIGLCLLPVAAFSHKAPESTTLSSRNLWYGIMLGVLNRKALSHGILMEEFPAVRRAQASTSL